MIDMLEVLSVKEVQIQPNGHQTRQGLEEIKENMKNFSHLTLQTDPANQTQNTWSEQDPHSLFNFYLSLRPSHHLDQKKYDSRSQKKEPGCK